MEFKRILLAVAGREAEDDAMRMACRIAKRNKAKIWSVYVITIKRALPLNAEIESEIRKAENVLDHIETIAEDEDYTIDTDVLQAREAGPAIIDEANEKECDLIVMGINYKRRFGQFSLGNVVPYVLQNAPCPVILYQHHKT